MVSMYCITIGDIMMMMMLMINFINENKERKDFTLTFSSVRNLIKLTDKMHM